MQRNNQARRLPSVDRNADAFFEAMAGAAPTRDALVPSRQRPLTKDRVSHGLLGRLFGDKEDHLHREAIRKIGHVHEEAEIAIYAQGRLAEDTLGVLVDSEATFEELIREYSDSHFVLRAAPAYTQLVRETMVAGVTRIARVSGDRIAREIERR